MSQPCVRCKVPTDHHVIAVHSPEGDQTPFALCGPCVEALRVPFAQQGFRMIPDGKAELSGPGAGGPALTDWAPGELMEAWGK